MCLDERRGGREGLGIFSGLALYQLVAISILIM